MPLNQQSQPLSPAGRATGADHDVVVIGAGLGGVYAIHRFRQQGLSVLCLEGADRVGGVWNHNRYPGARVDVESQDYSYFFSSEIYNEWRWSERYATQPEILRYIEFVADKIGIKPFISFNTWLTDAEWRDGLWHLTTKDDRRLTCRFLVMATGNYSAARKPNFKGLDDFKGEWVQTAHWPDRPVPIAGRRIAVIGTGSSGIQTTPVVAKDAQHVYVFQRTPNYSVPAHNGPLNEANYAKVKSDVLGTRARLLSNPGGSHIRVGKKKHDEYTPEEMREELERKWAFGGHGMNGVFSNQGTNQAANDIVSDFVRSKIRHIVRDPALAEKLCPFDHPIGTRRLCVDSDYYASFNRDNVTLVDAREEAIVEINATGIRTTQGQRDVDLIIFALGFDAFTGQFDRIRIVNDKGQRPNDAWKTGPCAYLGLMTAGFPNLFILTGPGSPAVLANLFLHNEFHADWVTECIDYLDKNGHRSIEATESAQADWAAQVQAASRPFLRRNVRNSMVHVNADGSQVFIPYIGGFGRYVQKCRDVAANGYEGFQLTKG